MDSRQQQLAEYTWGYHYMAHLVEMVPALRRLEEEHVLRSPAYLADLLSVYRTVWPRKELLTYCKMVYRVINTFNTAIVSEPPAAQRQVLRLFGGL